MRPNPTAARGEKHLPLSCFAHNCTASLAVPAPPMRGDCPMPIDRLGFLTLLSVAAVLAGCRDKAPETAAPDDAPVFKSGQGGELESTDQFQVGRPAFDVENHPGLALYTEHCAACHEGGAPKAPHRIWLEMMAPDMILA
ncbi:MAG: hypothetical protein D6782_11125, partial [Alphaproteobacteria bacterium]